MGIYSFWKAMRLMRLRDAPPSIRTWYSLTLAMVEETTSGSCPAPTMFLEQSEASNAIDVSIHLWWGTALGVGAASTTTLVQRLDNAPGHDVLGANVHDVELLVALIVTRFGVGVGVVVDDEDGYQGYHVS
jgi:hypothetical protein